MRVTFGELCLIHARSWTLEEAPIDEMSCSELLDCVTKCLTSGTFEKVAVTEEECESVSEMALVLSPEEAEPSACTR